MRSIGVDGMFNVRATHHERPWLIRAGAPEQLTEAGAAKLRQLGVTAFLDLREPGEAARTHQGIPVKNVPLYGAEAPSTGRLEDVYERLLRAHGQALTEAVRVIAEADGASVVHCTAGKDRTGLVVALALLAAGFSEEDVITDYASSGKHVRVVREAHALEIAEALDESERAEAMRLHLESPREAIEHAISIIDEFGGARQYLRANGLPESAIEQLRRHHPKGTMRDARVETGAK